MCWSVIAMGVRKVVLTPGWMKYPPISGRNFWWKQFHHQLFFSLCWFQFPKQEFLWICDSESLDSFLFSVLEQLFCASLFCFLCCWVFTCIGLLEMPWDRLFFTSILFSLILRKLRLMTTYCNLEWPAFEVEWLQDGGFQFLTVLSVKDMVFQKSSLFSLLMFL